MISDETKTQLAALDVDASRPLLICDVDEVIVHFTSDLEDYLGTKDLWLQPASFALNGNIRSTKDNSPVSIDIIGDLIDDFFALRTRNMKTIPGAVEALHAIKSRASIVLLTNLPHSAGDDRRANLADHGLSFPVITNSGPKGPAIKALAKRTAKPIVFVDDSPGFIQSAYEFAPHIHLVHFLQDQRFAVHSPNLDFVSLRTHSWDVARPHIIQLLEA
jgi:FMN phosphatase YigB (HAD superfamily)